MSKAILIENEIRGFVMGIAKEKQNEAFARGFDTIQGKYVCDKCIGDKFLRKELRSKVDSPQCSYCGRLSKGKNIATSVDMLMPSILEAINFEWSSAEHVPWVDGGFIGRVYNSWDMVHDFINHEAEIDNKELLNDIQRSLADQLWSDPSDLRIEDALHFSWQTFAKLVTHKYRYTFFEVDEKVFIDPYDDEFGSISPRDILRVLGSIVNSNKLVINLAEGTEIYRSRWFRNDENISEYKAKDMGSPPIGKADQACRMSPPGISLFYGALDSDTALKETSCSNSDCYSKIAKFKTLMGFKILDLVNVPHMPSIFDKKKRFLRPQIRFLAEFSQMIGQPITDGKQHIEYVPTQALTEYFRCVFKYKKERLDGVFYASAKNSGKVCCALFVENLECVDTVGGNKNSKLILETVTHGS